ncbi:efflux transporter outer membrane subunit [Zobellella sp. DQSA1]|uniref:efflux transporter outer membrane subunit n=1 Tax=Zobellella sp. DQSA1 TaxID=3342386 RepID=UPI0035C09E04
MTALSLRPLSLLLLLSLTGCALPEGGAPPALPLAGQWLSPTEGTAELDRQWWQGFGSPALDALVEQALPGAPELRIAAERIAQAEAQLTASGASLFPSLGASGSSNRSWSDPGAVGERSSLGLNLGYELDLWGKNRAERLAADANLDASRHDFESARLTLTAAVASAWFQLLATEERIRINERNLELARDNLAIVDAKYRYGAAALSDLRRQRTVVLGQEATLLPLREQARQTRSALAILLGHTPQSFETESGSLMALSIPAVGPGLPSELLSRRPDLASAEAALLAADANLAAARAALLPSVQLTGSGGLATDALLSLADPSRTLSLGASLGQVLFDGGRLRAQVRLTESRRRELAENYRKAALTALKEVEDALGNAALYRDQEAQQQLIVEEARESLRLVEARYREGADELLALLDAQRTLFGAEEQLASLRQNRLDGALNLFKALGGGWHAG